MKCIFCHERAGFLKRICPQCLQMGQAVQGLRAHFSYSELLDALMGTGASEQKIQKFLEADPYHEGSLRNQITARMTNEVMQGLGQPSDMDAKKVGQVRDDIAAGRLPSFAEQEVADIHQLKDYDKKV